jgi:hypothetical protein
VGNLFDDRRGEKAQPNDSTNVAFTNSLKLANFQPASSSVECTRRFMASVLMPISRTYGKRLERAFGSNDELENPLCVQRHRAVLVPAAVTSATQNSAVTRLVRSGKISRRTGTRSTMKQGNLHKNVPGRGLDRSGTRRSPL